jgi:hypothetical protein
MPTLHLCGPYGSSALPYIDRFAAHGVNAFWFHGFDDAAIDACARHGIAACVEFKTFRADFATRPELIPIGVDGRPIRYGELVQGVCLSQQDFLDETEAALLDGLRLFAPAGIWLDYLTYAGWFEMPQPDLQESCFCAACIAEFCQATGIDATTPQQILAEAPAAWQHHICKRIARFAAHYTSLLKSRTETHLCPGLRSVCAEQRCVSVKRGSLLIVCLGWFLLWHEKTTPFCVIEHNR